MEDKFLNKILFIILFRFFKYNNKFEIYKLLKYIEKSFFRRRNKLCIIMLIFRFGEILGNVKN